ncbi:MAG TPA: helix-turn-helix transcriptional regulator [Miltoncostaeaceae bacterium]|nr:helix-turn-helix transcriptional regulator [Miltoncostaeaceae bacterium]
MSSPILIGTALREARESRGLTLAQCEDAICIRTRYLSAIEDGRFDDLPDPAYVGGFVRAYAGYLGVRMEGIGEPDRELPVLRTPERQVRLDYLTVGRPPRRRGAGRRRLAWAVLSLLAVALLVIVALWLGVFDPTSGSPGGG